MATIIETSGRSLLLALYIRNKQAIAGILFGILLGIGYNVIANHLYTFRTLQDHNAELIQELEQCKGITTTSK